MTPNGKVNRQSLPAPDMGRVQAAGAFVAPRTTAERILADIWADVLRLERVGMHDNFFALGGDSILSIQIIARAHQTGLRLTLEATVSTSNDSRVGDGGGYHPIHPG